MSTQLPDAGAPPDAIKQIENGFSITTDMPPCCLEFCPEAPEFFVVGCYKLVEDAEPESKSEEKVEEAMQAMTLAEHDFLAEERELNCGAETPIPSKAKDDAKASSKDLDQEPKQAGEKEISPSESEETANILSTKELGEGRKEDGEKEKSPSESEGALQKQSNPPKRVQKRVGCLYLYRVYSLDSKTKSKQEQKIPFTSAILDFAFSNLTPKLLAIATSRGCIYLYRLNAFDGQLVFHSTVSVLKSDTLILAMNWMFPSTTSLGDRDCKRDMLATSDSDGDIILHYFSTPEYKYQHLTRLPKPSKHTDQAWCVAWTVNTKNFNRPILVSGGDDFQLIQHEFLRCIQQNGVPFVKLISTVTDTKTHGAGVTAIMPFPFYATEDRLLVLTGSYDDHVRIYNLGDRKNRVLAELNLGGGVWKLRILRDVAREQIILAQKALHTFDKEAENRRRSEPASEYAKVHPSARRRSQAPEAPPNPSSVPLRFKVIASCMYAGVRILDVKRDEEMRWSIEVVGKFEEGKSMAYAAAAAPLVDEDGQRYKGRVLCASTSFYDEKTFVWVWR